MLDPPRLAEVCEELAALETSEVPTYMEKVGEEVCLMAITRCEEGIPGGSSYPSNNGRSSSQSSSNSSYANKPGTASCSSSSTNLNSCSSPNTSPRPASEQLVDQVKPCAGLAMRMMATVATSTAALVELQPLLQARKQPTSYWKYDGCGDAFWETSAHDKACMEVMLRLATTTEVATILCDLLPVKEQRSDFSTACRAVQQLSSTELGELTPEVLLPVFAPMGTVPIILCSLCSNPQCVQLPGFGDAPRKPKVRKDLLRPQKCMIEGSKLTRKETPPAWHC